jgi:glycosyltransferase involved in cell wall biosynthesis
MTIDLVVATVGRTDELRRLLDSLVAQTNRRCRLIVVDQNPDERLGGLLAEYAHALDIQRVMSRPGLSRARNAGLDHVAGDVVAFPDDDAWYPPRLLEDVAARLAAHPEWNGLSARSTGSDGRPSSMLWDRSGGAIDRYNIWRRAISFTIFLRRALVDSVGEFDEKLGAGSGTDWGSGEETDYLLRALERGFRLHYDPSLQVHHESPRPDFSPSARVKAHRYGLGQGHVLRTHRYPAWFAWSRIAQLVVGSVYLLVTGRPAQARFYFSMATGRARGWAAGP